LTPLTIEHGMVNDELMHQFFAYYQTHGPQIAFEECVVANFIHVATPQYTCLGTWTY